MLVCRDSALRASGRFNVTHTTPSGRRSILIRSDMVATVPGRGYDGRVVSRPPWLSRTVVGIILATFLSDVGHEAVTAVLPLYLASVGLGPLALGVMEGIADLGFSLAKLAGGIV